MTAGIRYVRPKRFAELMGEPLEGVEGRIASWREGYEYRVAPDGRVLIDVARFDLPSSRPERRRRRRRVPPRRAGAPESCVGAVPDNYVP